MPNIKKQDATPNISGDVAQDSIRPSSAGRVWKIHRLAEVALRPAAVGDADGIQEIGVGRDRIGEAKLKNILWAAPTAF